MSLQSDIRKANKRLAATVSTLIADSNSWTQAEEWSESVSKGTISQRRATLDSVSIMARTLTQMSGESNIKYIKESIKVIQYDQLSADELAGVLDAGTILSLSYDLNLPLTLGEEWSAYWDRTYPSERYVCLVGSLLNAILIMLAILSKQSNKQVEGLWAEIAKSLLSR
jgi:hypothetical protein